MAFEVTLPRLGWSMEVGALAEWRKKDGDPVEAGEILFTVEGDKAIQEVEALESGILRIPPDAPPPGQEMPVGTLLAYIVQPGEAAPFESDGSQQSAVSSQESDSLLPTPYSRLPTPDSLLPAISPRARRVAQELGIDWAGLAGSGRSGRIVERDVRQAAELREALISPLARKLAEELGVNVEQLAARIPGRRIQRADVAAAARQAKVPVTDTQYEVAPSGQSLPVTAMRRTIAQRMAESAQTVAAVTLTTEADASELVALREQMKAALSPRGRLVPGYTDLIVKLTAVALQEHSMLNASWKESEIVIADDIHIAVAVDTDAGLLVPVVRSVPSKSVEQIADELRMLAEKARSRQLTPDDLQGGTFTVTNLGMYGIDAFAPIVNLPQCAILGVGRIISKPAVHNNQVLPRHMMALSLTFDHRVVDGGPAARFLNTVREYVEQPYLWLTR